MDAGGEGFSYVPALNATNGHIEALTQLVEDNLQGWQVPANKPEELAERLDLSEAQKNAQYPGRDM